jgi:4'-phosphopantetheinyl transferase EntD
LSSQAEISDQLGDLLPAGVVAAHLRVPANPELLLPEEREAVVKSVNKRVRDFAGGRLCARRALAELGIHDFPLRAGSDRRPLWPESVVGSITHTEDYCAAVVAPITQIRALGIDAEVIGRVTPSILGSICVPEEEAWLAGLSEDEAQVLSALVFSAKEAFYKCQYTLSQQWLDFTDARIDPRLSDFSRGQFVLQLLKPLEALTRDGPAFNGRFVVDGPHIITAMALVA